MSSQKKSERKCFKNILSEEQRNGLERYFVKVKQKPLRKEKIELAERLGISPYDLNKWFQARRNKETKMKKILPIVAGNVQHTLLHIDNMMHKTLNGKIIKRIPKPLIQPTRSVHFNMQKS